MFRRVCRERIHPFRKVGYHPCFVDGICSSVFVGNGFIRSERSVTIHVSLNGICSSVFVGNGFIRSERLVTIHVSLNGKCSIGTVGRVAWPQGPGNYCRALNGTMSRIPYGFVQPDIIQRKHPGIVTIRRGQAARPTVVSNVFPFNIPW